jgi:rhamnosyltransferase
VAAVADVCALVVTYNPDAGELARLLDACAPQAARVLIIDNGSDPRCAEWIEGRSRGNVSCLPLGKNLGVAAAHNRGIEWARERGATHVVLFDQDSVPSAAMVASLLDALARLARGGVPVAAVGPKCLDPRIGAQLPFVRVGYLRNTRVYCRGGEDSGYVRADFLISSGILIPVSVIDAIGGMDEGLFIDSVDLEWCFRATARGYALYGVCGAEMQHKLGHDVATTSFFGRRNIVLHPPTRLYYMMRNRVLLYRKKWTPPRWIFQDLFRLLFKFALFFLFIAPRGQNARMMLKGIGDGLAGRQGKLDVM